ncbi:unnamed protein product, partial [Brassica oleracea]
IKSPRPKGTKPVSKKTKHKAQTKTKRIHQSNQPNKDNRKDKTLDNNTRPKISGRETHPKKTTCRESFHLITAFEKQRQITEPTVYRNPPYHTGMTPEPRTSTVFIELEDNRTLPGNLTPTTEEHLQRMYQRFWGIRQLQRTRQSFGERQSI